MSLIWIVNILSVFFLCVFFAGIVIPQILLIAFRRRLFDEPDERKIHQCVVPRLGGMAFKPVVTNISLVDKHNKEFVAIGYECMGEFGIEGRRYFRKGGDNRTHQIHIFEQSNHKDINRHIAVRDFLRTHPDIALEYGELKMELAYRFSEDIEGYCTGKDAFVKQLEKDALLWYQNNESYKTR